KRLQMRSGNGGSLESASESSPCCQGTQAFSSAGIRESADPLHRYPSALPSFPYNRKETELWVETKSVSSTLSCVVNPLEEDLQMPSYRFGKHPPHIDYRTLRFEDYLSSTIALPPPAYDVLATSIYPKLKT